MAVVKTAADEFSAEIYNFVAGCCKGICLCAASGENKFAVFYCKRFDKRQFSGVDSSVSANAPFPARPRPRCLRTGTLSLRASIAEYVY